MKPSKPEWYDALKVDPLKNSALPDGMLDRIRSRSAAPDRIRKSKGRLLWTGAAILSIVLAAAVMKNGLPVRDAEAGKHAVPAHTEKPQPDAGKQTEPAGASAPLTFHPVAATTVKTGDPGENMKSVKIDRFQWVNGLPEAAVHLYAETQNPDLVHAYLESGGKLYEAGIVSSEGAAKVEVTVSHWTGEGDAEIRITGPLASESGHVQLLRYDPASANWTHYDFHGLPIRPIDLDGDGKNELVSNAVNAVPPYVEFYRWNAGEKRFESSQIEPDAARLYSIDREKVVTYSYLFEENGKWLIEFGTGEGTHYFFQYKNGAFEEAGLADNHSRLADFQKQKGIKF